MDFRRTQAFYLPDPDRNGLLVPPSKARAPRPGHGASSLCGACFDACPVRIDIPSMLVHLRARATDARARSKPLPSAEAVGIGAAAWVLRDPRRLRIAHRLSRLGRLLARWQSRRGGRPKWTPRADAAGWTKRR